MNTRSARVLRGLTAAFFAVFVAALSHAAGGGGAPGAVGLALALAFSAVICTALAGHTLSLLRLSLSVAVSQVILHTLFTVGAPAGSGGPSSPGGPGGGTLTLMGGMAHHASMLVPVADAPAAAAAALGGGFDPAAALLAALAAQLCSGMWIAHALAALVTIFALRSGESAFWGLLRLAGLRLRRLFRPLLDEPRTLPGLECSPVSLEPDHPRDLGIFLGRLRHRGPPLCVRFAD